MECRECKKKDKIIKELQKIWVLPTGKAIKEVMKDKDEIIKSQLKDWNRLVNDYRLLTIEKYELMGEKERLKASHKEKL